MVEQMPHVVNQMLPFGLAPSVCGGGAIVGQTPHIVLVPCVQKGGGGLWQVRCPMPDVAKQTLPFGHVPSVLGWGGYNRTDIPCLMRTEGGRGGYGRTDTAIRACAFSPWRGGYNRTDAPCPMRTEGGAMAGRHSMPHVMKQTLPFGLVPSVLGGGTTVGQSHWGHSEHCRSP